jgi:NAD(P)-dependent dehydrogenase (short-subunit alcohol dehydrogenase family)
MVATDAARAALVTGGGSGIGLACARALRELGYRVALCGRDTRKLEAAATAIGDAAWIACDVTNRDAVEAAVADTVDRFGRLDVVVANAGVFPPSRATLDRTPLDEWEVVTATNLDGVFHTLAAALPYLRVSAGYAFVIGSIYSRHALRLSAAYTASKFGALGLTHTLLQEHEEHGVRATAILPGIVDTSMVTGDHHRDELLRADDVARTLRWCLELSPAAIVREVTIERAGVARVDIELQETSPAWHNMRHPSWDTQTLADNRAT